MGDVVGKTSRSSSVVATDAKYNKENKRSSGNLSILVSLGFIEGHSLQALLSHNDDLGQAIQFLINNPIIYCSNNIDNRKKYFRSLINKRTHSKGSNGVQSAQGNLVRVKSSSGVKSGKFRTKKDLNHGLFKRKPSCKQKLLFESYSNILVEFPDTVDLLLHMLTSILVHPNDQKYREVYFHSSAFKRVIKGLPNNAAVAFILLCGFKPSDDWLVLDQKSEDLGLLSNAKKFLENCQYNPIYQVAKNRVDFDKMLQSSKETPSPDENYRREQLMRKVPKSPKCGDAGKTQITVFIGDDVIKRCFHSDNMIADIVTWLGATYNSSIPVHALNESWDLREKNPYLKGVLRVHLDYQRTLENAGLWPIAELMLEPRKVCSPPPSQQTLDM